MVLAMLRHEFEQLIPSFINVNEDLTTFVK